MNKSQFVNSVVSLARKNGWRIETNRNGFTQIDFGNKKLHAGHLEAMFPDVMEDGVSLTAVIDKVAPGRPCTHRPMRFIISKMKSE